MKPQGNSNKSKAKQSKIQKKPKKYFLCKFQTNPTYSNIQTRSIESDLCIICGFKASITVPNLKGKLAPHDCLAHICLPCLQRCLEHQFKLGITELFCPICLTVFSDNDRARIHPDVNNQISEQLTLKNLNLVECKFCTNRYQFEPATSPQVTSYHGRDLTTEQIECMMKNAVTCNQCHISSCYSCGAVPYHLGETCTEHEWWVDGSVCRICGRAAKPEGETSLRTCGHEDCLAISKRMCNHIHACGHACVGIHGEELHPPCPECTDSICPCCENDLWGSLCLLLECGHTLHLDCALKIIKSPREGPELRLPLCPYIGCGCFVKHEVLRKEAKEDYEEWLHLEPHIDRVAKQRVIAEGIDFHPEVVSKSSPYAQNCDGEIAALNWAKKKLRFMICRNHPIHLIYTSGRLKDIALPRYSCPECLHYPYPKCPIHSFNYMQYKCEYCCSIGVRRDKNKNGDIFWVCEICHDMPGRRSIASKEPCKGNCQFAPHLRNKSEYYGRCQKCGVVKSSTRPKPGTWSKSGK